MASWRDAPPVVPGNNKWEQAPATPTTNFKADSQTARAQTDAERAAQLAAERAAYKPGMIESGIRGAADMFSFGGGDEAVAGVKSFFGNGTYDENVAHERMLLEKAQHDNPVSFITGQVAGAVPSMLIPGTAAVRGANLVSKIGKGLLAGGVAGGLYGAGSGGDTLASRARSAATGAFTGGVIGGGFPVVGAAVGSAVRGGQTTASKLARALMDDGMSAPAAQQRLSTLGPNAVVADLGDNFRAQVAGLNSVPGPGQRIIPSTLGPRRAAANGRIIADTDIILGPAVSPAHVEAEITAAQKALSPQYTAALNGAKAVDTSGIAARLESEIVNVRGDAQAQLRKVRQMLDVYGAPGQLDPNPGTLLNTRQAIDGLLSKETDKNTIRVLSDARRMVDAELTAKVPGIKTVDAKFEELAKQQAGYTRGQQVLESGKTSPWPADLQAEFQTAGNLRGNPSQVPMRMSQGARSEIERIIGTNANDVVALRKLIKGEGSWNRDRLVTLFGRDKTDRMLAVLDRENIFDRTYQATQNSNTATKLAAKPEVAPEFQPLPSVTSVINNAAPWLVDQFRRARFDRLSKADNQALAEALMASGPQADQVVSGLAQALLRQNSGRAVESGFKLARIPSRAAALGYLMPPTQGNAQ